MTRRTKSQHEPCWNRSRILPRLVAERGLKTSGFRKAMHKLVEDHVTANWVQIDEECNSDLAEDEELLTMEECIKYDIAELIGDIKCVPAAYKITPTDAGGIDLGVVVDIYEFEFSSKVPDWKLSFYGDLADREGVFCNLHIIDRYGNERIIEDKYLMSLAFMKYHDVEFTHQILSCAKTSTVNATPMIHTTKKQERAILEAIYESGLITPEELNNDDDR